VGEFGLLNAILAISFGWRICEQLTASRDVVRNISARSDGRAPWRRIASRPNGEWNWPTDREWPAISDLGGELGDSSAGTAAEADRIVPNLALMQINTILMPVAWEQIEPKEGSFDFAILDHWIETARQHQIHLVPL
jgi:hypothetical protein